MTRLHWPPTAHPPGALWLPLLLVSAALPSCVATLHPGDIPRTPSQALLPAVDSSLGRIFAAAPGASDSAFAPLDRGDAGYDVRLALATAAESSIDAQSYLWHEDGCGSLLLDRLMEAADRGVRVRLLIDGFRLEGNEDLDRALSLHSNVEIRVFNPALHRGGLWKALEVAENLDRLDHRMHNKLFLVDGVAGVHGGRNIGDEYFGLGDEADLRDFDLLAAGPVLEELSQSFDEFWNGPFTVPLGGLPGAAAPDRVQQQHEEARAALRALHAEDVRLAGRRSYSTDDWLVALRRARDQMHSGRAQVLHDAADLASEGATTVLGRAFEEALARHHGDVLIVTAYLVPDATLLEHVRAHVAAGERVRILTNSFVSTNQPLVHAYYVAARPALLEAGAELYELRGDAWSHVRHRSPGSGARKLGLHAKSAVFGDSHVLVGSLNLDPRSMELNTELGVLIESRELAAAVRTCLEEEFAARNAWKVERTEGGGLSWKAQGVELFEEPDVGPGEHAREWFLRLLPLKGEV